MRAKNEMCRVSLLLVAANLAGCGSIAAVEDLPTSQASRVVIHEGLPHPINESAAFKAEKAGPKPIVERVGYWFYRDPLEVKPDDLAKLTRTLGDSSTYRSFVGEKKCGGFHPDYLVEWREGTSERAALLCFGCGEAKVVGPKGEHRYDLDKPAQTTLRTLLDAYRKNRPDPATTGGPSGEAADPAIRPGSP